FRLAQADRMRRHEAEVEQWKAACAAAKQARTPIPDRPRPERVCMKTFTLEALIRRLAQSPRRLLIAPDELNGLLGGLNQYKKGRGDDRERLLEIWRQEPVVLDRVQLEDGQPFVYAPHPCASIVGGLNADNLPNFLAAGQRKDGFIDRFLFVFPNQ